MSFNWEFTLQQLSMVALAGGLSAALFAALRLLGDRPPGWWRLWVEYPVVAVILYVIGARCRDFGWGHWLPNLDFAWTVGIALAMYWMAIWWPLRVLRHHRELRATTAGKLTLAAGAISALGALYSCFIETHWLEVEPRRVEIAELGQRELRVAHISDTQLIDLGPREYDLVDAVNAFEPHLIIFSGDYIATRAGEDVAMDAVRFIVDNLRASHGVFATPSDSDLERHRQAIFAGTDVHYMVNDSTTVDVDGLTVRVGCLDHVAPSFSRVGHGAQDDELFIVACHNPDFAEPTSERLPTADLYLCGHTHGGQVQIPFFGPPVTMCNSPRRIAAGGVFETERGMPFALSRGVGSEGDWSPRFRFNCRPHVFLFTLSGSPTPRPSGN